MKNQRGITLIELLVAITLLSIVGIIIWNVFIQGTNYSNEAMTKNQLNQEANIITTSLKDIHQNSNSYEIKSENCKITIKSDRRSISYENPNVCYYLELENRESGNTLVDDEFFPKKEQDYQKNFILTVKDKNNPNNKVKISTNLYRLKEG